MKVADTLNEFHITDSGELERILFLRPDGVHNAFWLFSDDSGGYPALAILVKGDCATLNYFPKEHDAGSRSVGSGMCTSGLSALEFAISRHAGDNVTVSCDAIVRHSDAVVAAIQFLRNSKMPPAHIQWLSL